MSNAMFFVAGVIVGFVICGLIAGYVYSMCHNDENPFKP